MFSEKLTVPIILDDPRSNARDLEVLAIQRRSLVGARDHSPPLMAVIVEGFTAQCPGNVVETR